MTTYRVGIRICAEGPCQVEFREFVPVFHRWIQSGFIDGPLLDVADYSHVSNGPGILLAGFDANYSIETTAGVLSLVGYRKRPTGMSLQDTLIGHARRVIALCAELEADAMFRGRLRFRGGVVHVFSNDRLLAPNTDLTESEWRPVVQGLARALWGEADVSVERDQSDPRERFSMTLRSSRSPAVGEIQTTLLPSPPNGSA